MKKSLLFAFLWVAAGAYHAQCVYTCSNYIVSPITFSTFPQGQTNITPTFTGYNGTFNDDDGDSGPVPIGFSFNYYCNTYSNVIICANGFIQFDYAPLYWPSAAVHNTQNFPNSSTPNGIVAYNMTDLYPGIGGTISYTTIGTAPNRVFIVTYSNVPLFTTTSNLNSGQIVLYETSNIIEIHTGTAFGDSNQSTYGYTSQGIENTNGTLASWPGMPACGRNACAGGAWTSSANSTAYRFTPVGPTPPTGLTGNTVLCQGDVGNYFINSSPGATLYTWSTPGWPGTSTTTAATFTTNASGNLSVTASYTCGTSSAITLSVQVNPAPVVSIQSATPNLMCSGTTVTFNLAGAANYTLEPGTIIGGSPLNDTPLVSTTYTVTGTSSFGCNSINSAQVFITVNPTPTVTVNSGAVCLGEAFTMVPSGADLYSYSSVFATVTQTPAGTYTFSVTGTYTNGGCVGVPAISSLTVHPLPVVNVASPKQVICKGETAVLTASGATSYSWTNNLGTNAVVTVTPNLVTTYSVTGTNVNGCKSSGGITIGVNSCAGIGENNAQSLLSVYPNPVEQFMKISSATPLSLKIFDVGGRVVYESKVEAGEQAIDLGGISAGQYILRAEGVTGARQHMILIKQ
jgi:hypothetical protein